MAAARVVPATKAQYASLKSLLRNVSARRAEGRFVVEGPVLVAELLASNLEVVHLVGTEELLGVHAHTGVDLFDAPPDRLSAVLSTNNPQPIAAVAQIPETTAVPAGGLLALVDISDPGNVGTMIRTAEASGAAGVLLVGNCVDQWNPKVIRASAGAVFRLPVLPLSVDGLFELNRPDILATVVDDGADYRHVDLADAVICLGNEAHGLDPAFVDRCHGSITIPLPGPTESLNVAAAAAVVAFAALDQRRQHAPKNRKDVPNA